ncbi:MAG: patatin family protein [Bacteroidales bacterium]|nr:patatin family protein [Bacteroidales bacterium]
MNRERVYTLNEKSSLILEGGGMRGTFTSGVLDNLMDRGIRFPFTIGVSAGACNGLSYMSQQRGRAKFSNIDLLEKYRYVGLKYLFTQRNIMDFKLLFEDFPERILPYDYPAYFNCKERFAMVTTNCLTGEPNYFEEKQSAERVMEIVRASSSMPFVSRICHVDDIPMMDGGISDSIPLFYSRQIGFTNNLVVLTRNRGYRKKIKNQPYLKLFYRKYPKFQEAIANRNLIYNHTLDCIEDLEDKGEIIVLRPVKALEVDRIEKDCNKLRALYDEGYDLASKIKFDIK